MNAREEGRAWAYRRALAMDPTERVAFALRLSLVECPGGAWETLIPLYDRGVVDGFRQARAELEAGAS